MLDLERYQEGAQEQERLVLMLTFAKVATFLEHQENLHLDIDDYYTEIA